jgi:hypothetical protein
MKKFLITACAAVWALNIFDYLSTRFLLDHGGEEWNPFMYFLMNHLGTDAAMLITKIPFLLLLAWVTYKSNRKVLNKREKIALPCGYAFLVFFYSYVMYNYNLQGLLLPHG